MSHQSPAVSKKSAANRSRSGHSVCGMPSGRASDSGARGRGFDPHSGRRVVSLSKIHSPPKSTGDTQEAVTPSRHD